MGKEYKNGFTKIKFLIITIAIASCAGYLCIINIGAVKGYEIRKVENKIAELKKENKQLQIEEAELSSFYNIKKEVGSLNMVEAKEIVYINDNNQIMAFKN
ncbi:MAG TPA: hypothetical protein ENJ27_01450 [Candidatus Moranbacteria bacterium]|nr:hypothetical protein [Candidatus Moranbacteria bacterium]